MDGQTLSMDFATKSGCEQIIHRPTHKSGNTLDLIFIDAMSLLPVM